MFANPQRQLLVIADDFGIGPNTTAGILQLAAQSVITGSALLVNSPYAVDAMHKWHRQGASLELGWHPNLTLDSPIAPVPEVASLVRSDGTFWPLGSFLKRWLLGRLEPRDVECELRAQLQRFIELVGSPPRFVNFHQHIGVFSPIGEILLNVLAELPYRPYLRRVQEPWTILRRLPRARFKRAFLNWLGRRYSRAQEAHGFPGNDWLAGIATPECVQDPQFFVNWLSTMPGNVVELMCHPGRHDGTLVGRDCTSNDGLLEQRVNELHWLRDPSFMDAVSAAGFRLVSPSEFLGVQNRWRQSA
jgi:predicted glycoside hydrolase/deacetylase ChbG (UPF0249 family)